MVYALLSETEDHAGESCDLIAPAGAGVVLEVGLRTQLWHALTTNSYVHFLLTWPTFRKIPR